MKNLSTTGNSTKIYKYSYGLLFFLLKQQQYEGNFMILTYGMSNVYFLT